MAAALRADESLTPFGVTTCDAHTSACGHRDREILTGAAAELRHVAREGVRLLIAQRDPFDAVVECARGEDGGERLPKRDHRRRTHVQRVRWITKGVRRPCRR